MLDVLCSKTGATKQTLFLVRVAPATTKSGDTRDLVMEFISSPTMQYKTFKTNPNTIEWNADEKEFSGTLVDEGHFKLACFGNEYELAETMVKEAQLAAPVTLRFLNLEVTPAVAPTPAELQVFKSLHDAYGRIQLLPQGAVCLSVDTRSNFLKRVKAVQKEHIAAVVQHASVRVESVKTYSMFAYSTSCVDNDTFLQYEYVGARTPLSLPVAWPLALETVWKNAASVQNETDGKE